MKIIYIGFPVIVLDSYESKARDTVIELTVEPEGGFGVYTRVGNFSYTIGFSNLFDAQTYYFAVLDIEELIDNVQAILNPFFGIDLIEFEPEEIFIFA